MCLLIEESGVPFSTKLGGLPVGVTDFEWPACRACNGPMQFVAQIKLADCKDPSFCARLDLLLIFMCQNDPGMCDDWDANSGGNAIVIVAPGTAEIHAPSSGVTTLQSESFAVLRPFESGRSKETGADEYVTAIQENHRILGKIGGSPLWIQGDETPDCDCGAPMRFVALLEERGRSGVNFGGGGRGYAFACGDCRDKAKFLWQC